MNPDSDIHGTRAAYLITPPKGGQYLTPGSLEWDETLPHHLGVSSAHSGNAEHPTNEEPLMNANNNSKLALRRSSIRTLTADELRTVQGGAIKFSDHGSGCATSDRCPSARCYPTSSSSSW
jgi:hypothetical protein